MDGRWALIVAWLVLGWLVAAPAVAQDDDEAPAPPAVEEGWESKVPSGLFGALRARSIGPAVASGRVGDFAVNPRNFSEYYVAVSSGGVWKTTDGGVTFDPIFDAQGSYSIGCVALDPSNPSVVWVGTGENNSQRSVAFGDGVYRSRDGGKTWENVGLRESEHIGMIAIDPRDSRVVYVAAQGPLWRAGGDRGLYKTTDGGETWARILHISEDTGVGEVHLDPRDPDTLYCTAYQRRRHVWTLIDGGPESGIWKSTDGGATWREINRGLPGGDKGRIGMDISPANPDVLYAIVDAERGSGGVYRSVDRGESWQKRNSFMSSSPQYYNEVFADPKNPDRAYFIDTFLMVTEDGGATLSRMPIRGKHVDDHVVWINPGDTDHLRVGCDGGIYETWNRGGSWHFKPNLPVTQFYRVAVDNAEPFYNVYGGTQDNNTLGGPSRTLGSGISNDEWFVVVGGDGFEPQIDPTDPNIVYGQWQYGGLVRYDRRSEERVDIKPREKPGEAPYVFNWDSPLLISPHNSLKIYFGGRALYRSDDRGDSWRAISGDLTRGIDRNTLKVFGRIPKHDAVSKHLYTSIYGNTVALTESPLVEGLIYVGTDDGLVHVTENGGETWRRIEVFRGVPDMTYVSCLLASRHSADTVFAAFDNHKNGDFKPYVLRSDDRGQTWRSIAGDLSERDIVYTIAEDHVRPDLLFVGTEFGARYTLTGGEQWTKIAGLPTIAVRDIDIQRRENDVVMATFGRGFYVLDDYSPMQNLGPEDLKKPAHIFPVRPALRYLPGGRGGRGAQGASHYSAPNPAFGATITFHLKEGLKTLADKRGERGGKDEPYIPTADELRAEQEEPEPLVLLTIRNEGGEVVRRLRGPRSKGLHRVTWDLRLGSEDASGTSWAGSAMLALPGTYTVSISKLESGVVTELAGPVPIEVRPLDLATFAAKDRNEAIEFQVRVARVRASVSAAIRVAGEASSRLSEVRQAVLNTPTADPALVAEVDAVLSKLRPLQRALTGDSLREQLSEPAPISIAERVGVAAGSWSITSPPTGTQREQLEYASTEFDGVVASLREIVEKDLRALEAKLDELGAPWTPGRFPRWPIK